MIVGGLLTAWGVFRVAAWVRDLPNRIVIDGDAFAEALGEAVTESYHEGLRNGDSATQAKVLREFSGFAAHDAALREWIRTEYSDDLKQLRSSADDDVATVAAKLLEQLDMQEDVEALSPTGHQDRG
jgi:hypothetical protein